MNFKRFLPILATIVLLISMVSVSAFADDSSAYIYSDFTVYAASLPDRPYRNFRFSESFPLEFYDSITFEDFAVSMFPKLIAEGLTPFDSSSSGGPFKMVISDPVSSDYFWLYMDENGSICSDSSSGFSANLRPGSYVVVVYCYDVPGSFDPSIPVPSTPSTPTNPPSDHFHQDLTDVVTTDSISTVLDGVVGLLPLVIPVLIAAIGLRKGISWLMDFLHSA